METEKLIGLIMWGVGASVFSFLCWKHGRDIWKAVKGEDNRLQLTEVVAFFWLILFPIAFFTDLSPYIDVSDTVWTSLDVIFAVIIAGNVAEKKFKNGDSTKREGDIE